MDEIRFKKIINIDIDNKIHNLQLLAKKEDITKENWKEITIEKVKKRKTKDFLEYGDKQRKYLEDILK